MTARELLATLYAAGIEVWADGDRVCVCPVNRLDPAWTRDIADLRDDLLALLLLPGRTLEEMIDDWRARGAEVFRRGARLMVRPRGMVTVDERIIIQRRTPELLALVDEDETLAREFWPEGLDGIGARTLGPRRQCSLCLVPTHVFFGDDVVRIPYCHECAKSPGAAAQRQYYFALRTLWLAHDPEHIVSIRSNVLRLLDACGVERAAAVSAYLRSELEHSSDRRITRSDL